MWQQEWTKIPRNVYRKDNITHPKYKYPFMVFGQCQKKNVMLMEYGTLSKEENEFLESQIQLN